MSAANNLQAVRAVFQARKAELIEHYGAQGAGIGKRQPADVGYVIVVYLRSEADRPQGEIEVDGVPVDFVTTGRFRPQ